MKSFLVTYHHKTVDSLTKDLLQQHILFLQEMYEQKYLQLCGPFTNNDGAFMIYEGESEYQIKNLVITDPFIKKGYYQTYRIHEYIEANPDNRWLIDESQTINNL